MKSGIVRALPLIALLGGFSTVTPVLAQQECTCVLQSVAGSVTSASGGTLMTVGGATEQVAATNGAAVGSNTGISTGATGVAMVNLGSGCQFSMGSGMTMQIVPAAAPGGGQCVQVISDRELILADDSNGGGGGGGLAGGALPVVIGAGSVLGVGVLVSLGMRESVSR